MQTSPERQAFTFCSEWITTCMSYYLYFSINSSNYKLYFSCYDVKEGQSFATSLLT